jgi:hypothetical protein
VRLPALDEFRQLVDVRRASIVNDVADWLKDRLAIVVSGLQRCLEVRRGFGSTLRVSAFR